MMHLQDIGFYTLSDERATTASEFSPLWRCELILTSACNFNCSYCRGFQEENKGSLSLDAAKQVVDAWVAEGLQHVRFSGGEPSLWYAIEELIAYTAAQGVKRIALSTNGSAAREHYERLLQAGCNDFSISLDACCAATADSVSRTPGTFATVCSNIAWLAKRTYVTVGVVLTATNAPEVEGIMQLAHDLGVADIRLITAAQSHDQLHALSIPTPILAKHPILRYRHHNLKSERAVRGLRATDARKCHLCLDDMAVLNGKHYPCIIYMREWGEPIGPMCGDFRAERRRWYEEHDSWADPICRYNCLDVCIDYNNKAAHHA